MTYDSQKPSETTNIHGTGEGNLTSVLPKWQPIETAPRDGTWFVICNAEDDRDGYEVGCYDPYMTTDYIETEPGSDVYRKVKRSSYDWTGFNNFHRATHWMPLPKPPVL